MQVLKFRGTPSVSLACPSNKSKSMYTINVDVIIWHTGGE